MVQPALEHQVQVLVEFAPDDGDRGDDAEDACQPRSKWIKADRLKWPCARTASPVAIVAMAAAVIVVAS